MSPLRTAARCVVVITAGAGCDHLVSLELRDAPNDPYTPWADLGQIPDPKDRVENRLRRDVCAHKIALLMAQRKIARDWVDTYHAAQLAG